MIINLSKMSKAKYHLGLFCASRLGLTEQALQYSCNAALLTPFNLVYKF